MRGRSKKIVLIESISTLQTEKDSRFMDHGDHQMPMRIFRNEAEEEGSLAQIFYQALLNQSIKKRQPQKAVLTQRQAKMSSMPLGSSEKRSNSGRIVRRSLSKSGSISSSPEPHPMKALRMEGGSVQLTAKSDVERKITSSRVCSKEISKMTPSTDKSIGSSRRSISSKLDIKYTVRSIRS